MLARLNEPTGAYSPEVVVYRAALNWSLCKEMKLRATHGISGRKKTTDIATPINTTLRQPSDLHQRSANTAPATASRSGISGRTRLATPVRNAPSKVAVAGVIRRGWPLKENSVVSRFRPKTKKTNAAVVRNAARTSDRTAAV